MGDGKRECGRADRRTVVSGRGAVGLIVVAAMLARLLVVVPAAGASGATTTGGAAQLVVSTSPRSATGGLPFGTQPVVTFEDGSGATVTAATATVTLSIRAGTGAVGAVLTCAPVSAVNGVATFSGCAIDKAASGYTLTATSDTLSNPSAAFDVTVGPPARASFIQQPTSIVAGAPFAMAPTVAVTDAGANVVTTSADAIGLSVVSGVGTGPLACTGGETAAPPTAPPGYKLVATTGIAAFAGCTIDVASSATYQLVSEATDGTSAGTFVTTSAPFAVTGGAAARLGFVTNPTGAQAGAPFSTQPVAALKDAVGNVVATATDTLRLSITAATGTVGATLTCAPVAALAGTATFAGCGIDKSGAGYTLTVSGAGFTGTSSPFNVTVSGAASLSFTTEPGNGTGGTALSTAPTVTVEDAGGNPVSGSVQLALTGGPAGARLSCPADPASAGTGRVTFNGCTVDRSATGYRLVATDPAAPGLTATSAPFDVAVGPAARAVFVSPPSGATGGRPFTGQPVVAVQDLGGNPVSVPNDTVHLAIAAGTGAAGARLTCTGDPGGTATTSTGTATFSGCLIDKAGTGYQLTVAAEAFVATSALFSVMAGNAARLVFTVQPSSGIVASPFGSQPQLTVSDAGGNPVGPVAATVTLSSGAGLSCRANPVSTTTGVVSFSACQVGSAGTFTLTATANGLAAATSGPFTVVKGAPLGVAPVPMPLAQTFGGALYSRNTTSVVDDVNSATGALQLSTTDVSVAGVGEAFVLARQYNSADGTGGVFGPGWSSILDAGVTIAGDAKSAIVRGEDGQQLVFTSSGKGGWIAPAGARVSLACQSQICVVTRFDGVTWHSTAGHIQDFLTAEGQGLHFTYAGTTLAAVTIQTSGSPLVVAVTENSAGQVTMINTPTRSVSYGYTGTALTRFTDADGNPWTYSYGPAGSSLTQEIDPLGQLRLSVAYSGGRVASASELGSQKHFVDTYAWDASTQVSTRSSRVTTAAGVTTGAYLDQYKSNVLVSQQFPDGALTAYSYDNQFNLVTVQDALGRVQQMAYSAAGDLISEVTPYTATASAVTRLTYDSSHRTLTVTDPNGNTTDYKYAGTNVFVTPAGPPPAPGKIQYQHNELGEMVEEDTPTGIVKVGYDAAGNEVGFQQLDLLGKVLNGAGPVVTYDEAGHAVTSADARGNTPGGVDPAYQSTTTYDAVGNLLSSDPPGGPPTSTTYTTAGDVASQTDPTGQRTVYRWDESTLTDTAVGPTGAVTSVSHYDPSGTLLARTDAGGRTTASTYDSTGRQLTRTDPANVTTTSTVDLEGNVVATSDTTGHTSAFSYDLQNRVARSTVNGLITASSYDPAGNVSSQTDASGRRTTYAYTNHETMASVTSGAGTTSYGYDLSGNLTSVTDGNGHTTAFSYNGASQKTAMTVNGQVTTYAYDVAGNLISTTDPDGRTTSYTVNAVDLRTGISYSQPGQATIAVTQQYNAAGRRIQMTDPTTGTHTYTYDAGGNLTKADNGAANTFSYDYSRPGQMTETYPDGTPITYTFDDAHNVMSVTSPGVSVSYLRDTLRQITGIAYSNGVLETQAHNQAGQLVNQSLTCAGTSEASSAWSYDAGGSPVGQSATVGTLTSITGYGYDSAGRLAAQSSTTGPAATPTTPGPCTTGVQSTPGSPQQNDNSGGTPNATAPTTATPPTSPAIGSPGVATTANPIAYDSVGNRTAAGGATSAYNAGDELTSRTGAQPATYSYDKAGNVTSMTVGGAATVYRYDAADRLTTVTTGSTTVSYAYDGDGNRASRTVSGGSVTAVDRYSWDLNARIPLLALERDGASNLIRRYLYGVGPVVMQTPAGTFYLHTDQQGDITQVSDPTGAVVEAYHYDGFGNIIATTVGTTPAPDNPLLFQGQYLDTATGLYYMRARNYDPTTGRFTQRDPVLPEAGTPVVSPYVFAGDQPTVNGDATGMEPATVNAALNGHSTESANTVNDASLSLKASKLVIVKPAIKLAAYFGAFKQAGIAAGRQAFASGKNIAEALAEGGETKDGADASEKSGKLLGVAGIALGLYVTIEDCEHGTVQQCVGDTVGLAFAVGCLGISSGAGSFVCGLIGAGIAIVISTYGPEIVQGLIDLGVVAAATVAINAIADGFTTAGAVLGGAFAQLGTSITSGVDQAVGALATGFNEAVAAISSGFNSAVSALEQAGYSAVQMADALASSFSQGVSTVVNELATLGYDVDGVVSALKNAFGQVAQQAAAILQTFGYGINQLMSGLKSAYQATAAAAAQVLQALNYAVDQISGALNTVYALAAAATAAVLQGLNYAVDQIAAALKAAYNVAAAALTTILQGLNYTLDDIATGLSSAYAYVDAQVAALYHSLGVAAAAIAGALHDAFHDADVAVAGVLTTIGVAADQVAMALEVAYGEAAQAVAAVLKAIGDAVTTIANALSDVFGQATAAIENILSAIGFTSSVISAIGDAFTSFGQSVASAFESAFSWL